MESAKELRKSIVSHDRAKLIKGKRTKYIPCYCMNCESNRSKLFALTGTPSKK